MQLPTMLYGASHNNSRYIEIRKYIKICWGSRKKAEAHAKAQAGAIDKKLASKQDINELKRDIKEIELHIKEVELHMTIKLGSIMLAGLGLMNLFEL